MDLEENSETSRSGFAIFYETGTPGIATELLGKNFQTV
jgi:hypothetical protein